MCILILNGYSKDLLVFILYYGQQSDVNVIIGLLFFLSKSFIKVSVGVWSILFMNGFIFMLDKNVNLNMLENFKGKVIKKYVEYKVILFLIDEQFYF